ncbi:OmpA family protein [Actinomadura kijaniata]|uniref:OmpA family protein n=1 Tax=Actinomadura kijaniata TaxID=46161 RepID=UPI001470F2F9|nr:OmpA family protein [Actinomadura kijaniata]
MERYPDRSVLRFHFTNLDTDNSSFKLGVSMASDSFGQVVMYLVDPVGRKLYQALYDGDDQPAGSDFRNVDAAPGVRYEAQIHFPPLPKDVRAVTVVTPTTAGEFTGVPVVEGRNPAPNAPLPSPDTTPPPGTTVAVPARRPQGTPRGRVWGLYGMAFGQVKSETTTSGEHRVGLRSDVLFDFDKATLTPRARQILDEVAAQTRREADPAEPPITITGHTDGHGDPGYNRPLSERRARVVLTELRARLGDAYRYHAEGRGQTQPVAREGGANDEQARARNRRVEISYRIRRATTRTATGDARGPVSPAAVTAPPARFRPDDGPTVAGRTVRGNGGSRRIDVKPFYRDGAYLVAVFSITNLGPDALNPIEDYSSELGGRFGAFNVVDPRTGTTHQGVMIGPPTRDDGSNQERLDPQWAAFVTEPGTTNRGFFHVPAPPPTTTSVTFQAGPFGSFPNVPVR